MACRGLAGDERVGDHAKGQLPVAQVREHLGQAVLDGHEPAQRLVPQARQLHGLIERQIVAHAGGELADDVQRVELSAGQSALEVVPADRPQLPAMVSRK